MLPSITRNIRVFLFFFQSRSSYRSSFFAFDPLIHCPSPRETGEPPRSRAGFREGRVRQVWAFDVGKKMEKEPWCFHYFFEEQSFLGKALC